MSRRARLTLPLHIRLSLNLQTGFYESAEGGVLYQLTFAQMNDLKLYCRMSHGSMVPTLGSWFQSLNYFDRRVVKRTGAETSDTGFYPDE